MLGILGAILGSNVGRFCIAATVIVAAFTVQNMQLEGARHGEAAAKATAVSASAAAKASEAARKAEFAQATAGVAAAEVGCQARVAAAHQVADKIRTIVEKPHATDPKTGCPLRALVGAGELRDALQPAA